MPTAARARRRRHVIEIREKRVGWSLIFLFIFFHYNYYRLLFVFGRLFFYYFFIFFYRLADNDGIIL